MKYKLLVVSILWSVLAYAQPREITIVATGDGETKEEATNNALRSAVEQAFGVFVSANTEILNDEITKDEVATVSSGNIKSFEVNAYTEGLDGVKTVTVSTVISLGKLIEYTANHGHTTEFAGNTFGANVKLYELNRAASVKALKHLYYTLPQLLPKMYDYKLTVKDPVIDIEKGSGTVEMTVDILTNKNTKEIADYFTNTILAMAAAQKTAEALSNNGMGFHAYYAYPFQKLDEIEERFYVFKAGGMFSKTLRITPYYLYAPLDDVLINWLFLSSMCSFNIVDNLGNQYHFRLPNETLLRDDGRKDLFIFNNYFCEYLSWSGRQWTWAEGCAYFRFPGWLKHTGIYSHLTMENNGQVLRDLCLPNSQFGGVLTTEASSKPGTVRYKLSESITIPREKLFKISQFQIVPDNNTGYSIVLEYACRKYGGYINQAISIYKFSLITGLSIPEDLLKRIEEYITEDPFDNQKISTSKKKK